jgi:hypothetical protein
MLPNQANAVTILPPQPAHLYIKKKEKRIDFKNVHVQTLII